MNAPRVAFLFTLAVVAATYLPQLGAPFELQDDHRIIAPLITPHPGGIAGAVGMWAATVRNDVNEVGRFRPVNQFFDVIGPLVLARKIVRFRRGWPLEDPDFYDNLAREVTMGKGCSLPKRALEIAVAAAITAFVLALLERHDSIVEAEPIIRVEQQYGEVAGLPANKEAVRVLLRR